MGGRAGLSSTKKMSSSSSSRGVVKTHALFGRKKVEPPPPPPPPPPSGPFGFLKKKAPEQQQQQQVRDVEYVPQETMSDAYARVKKQREKKAAMYEAKEKGGLSLFMFNALSAVNFEEDIEEDRGLLSAAKRMGKGEKMSREQYNALQRKVGGTKGGFFGDNIFAKGEYLDKGYEVAPEEEPAEMVGKPFLYGVLVAVLGATGYVVYAVGQAGAI